MNPTFAAPASPSASLANDLAAVKNRLEEAEKKLAAVQLEQQTMLQVSNDHSTTTLKVELTIAFQAKLTDVKTQLKAVNDKLAALQLEQGSPLQIANDQGFHQNAQLASMQNDVHGIRAQYNIILDHWKKRQVVDTNLIQRFVDVEEESNRQKMAMEGLEQAMRDLSTIQTAATGQARSGTSHTSASAARPPPPPATSPPHPPPPPTALPTRPPPPPGISASTAAAAARLLASLPGHPTDLPADSPQHQASSGPAASTGAPLQPIYAHPRAQGSAAAHKSGMDSRRSARVPPRDPAAGVEGAVEEPAARAEEPAAQQHSRHGGDGGGGDNDDDDEEEEVDDGEVLFDIDPLPRLRFAPSRNPNHIKWFGSNKTNETYVAMPRSGYPDGMFPALAREHAAIVKAAAEAGEPIEGKKGKQLSASRVQSQVVACLVDPANRERWEYEGEWDAYEGRLRDVVFAEDEKPG